MTLPRTIQRPEDSTGQSPEATHAGGHCQPHDRQEQQRNKAGGETPPKGLVSRVVCEANRRQVDIGITLKGLRVLGIIDKASKGWTGTLRNISKAEAQELNRILDKLRG